MSNIFTGTSNFPAPDTWPWLFNQLETDDSTFTTLFAEHPNKLGDFIMKAEAQLIQPSAKSDGTIGQLCYQYHLRANMAQLMAAFEYNAWALSTQWFPGNVIPFEFVFTEDTAAYSNWGASSDHGTYSRMLVEATGLSAVLQGDNIFTSYPMVSVCLRPSPGMRGIHSAAEWACGPLHCTAVCRVGQDLNGQRALVVGGNIVYTEAYYYPISDTDYKAASNNWTSQFYGIDLHMTVMGVRA